jgi:hypothetical protein
MSLRGFGNQVLLRLRTAVATRAFFWLHSVRLADRVERPLTVSISATEWAMPRTMRLAMLLSKKTIVASCLPVLIHKVRIRPSSNQPERTSVATTTGSRLSRGGAGLRIGPHQ